MRMRIVQVSCLLVLGFLANSSPVGARSLWEGPCVGRHCTSCSDPDPSGVNCWVGPGSGEQETCQYYGCAALVVCGENDQYVQCECPPCGER